MCSTGGPNRDKVNFVVEFTLTCVATTCMRTFYTTVHQKKEETFLLRGGSPKVTLWRNGACNSVASTRRPMARVISGRKHIKNPFENYGAPIVPK